MFPLPSVGSMSSFLLGGLLGASLRVELVLRIESNPSLRLPPPSQQGFLDTGTNSVGVVEFRSTLGRARAKLCRRANNEQLWATQVDLVPDPPKKQWGQHNNPGHT